MGKRLNIQDAAFLQVETPECPAHVAGLQVFQLPKGYRGNFFRDLMEMFDPDEPPAPPFNYKLQNDFTKLDVWPHWEEDPDFDLDYHVRYAALPAPGNDDQLMKLVERLHSRPLDRTRPLWECYMIEGLSERRVALYFKVHHSAIDGVAAMAMMERALSDNPKEKLRTAFWQTKPSRAIANKSSGMLDTLAEGYAGLLGQAKAATELSTALIRTGLRTLGGARQRAPFPFTAPSTRFNVDITNHRRFAVASLSLSRVRRLSKDLDATINDVVLALCGGALRKYLSEHNELPDKQLLAMCPVSIRPEVADDGGNYLSMIVSGTGTNIEDPLDRLIAIRQGVNEAKEQVGRLSRESATNYALLMNGAVLLSQALNLSNIVAPPANIVISNVPGPRKKLYLNGAELLANYPVSLVVNGIALNMTVTSYADTMDFGLLAAREAVPDLEKITAYILDECDELERAAKRYLKGQAEKSRGRLEDLRQHTAKPGKNNGAKKTAAKSRKKTGAGKKTAAGKSPPKAKTASRKAKPKAKRAVQSKKTAAKPARSSSS